MSDTSKVIPLIKEYGAIYAKPWTCGLSNGITMCLQHFKDYKYALDVVVNQFFPDYKDVLNEFFNDKYCCYCNMFIMKKEDFLEGCEFVFGVLEKIDEYFGVGNDEEVRRMITKKIKLLKQKEENIKWQVRMEGFFGEYLWDIFRRKKFKDSYVSRLIVLGDRDMSYQSE